MTELNERGSMSKVYLAMLEGASAGALAFLGGVLPSVAKSTAAYYATKLGSWLLTVPTWRSAEGQDFAANQYNYEPLRDRFLEISPGIKRTRAKLSSEELKEVEDFERRIFRELKNDIKPDYEELLKSEKSAFEPLFKDFSNFRLPHALYAGPGYSGGRYFKAAEKFKAKDLAVIPSNDLDTWAREHDIMFALASSIRDPGARRRAQVHANSVFNARIKSGLNLPDLPGDYTNRIYDFVTNKLPYITTAVNLLAMPIKSSYDYFRLFSTLNTELFKGRRPEGGLRKLERDIVHVETTIDEQLSREIIAVDELGNPIFETLIHEVPNYEATFDNIDVVKTFEAPYVQKYLSAINQNDKDEIERFKFFYSDPEIRKSLQLDKFAKLWSKLDTRDTPDAKRRNELIQAKINSLTNRVNDELTRKGLISAEGVDPLLTNSKYGTVGKRLKESLLQPEFLKAVATSILASLTIDSIETLLGEISGRGVNEVKYNSEADFRRSIDEFVKKYAELPRANKRLAESAEVLFRYIQNDLPFNYHTDKEIQLLLDALDAVDLKDPIIREILKTRPQLAEVFLGREKEGTLFSDAKLVAGSHLGSKTKEILDAIEKVETMQEYGEFEMDAINEEANKLEETIKLVDAQPPPQETSEPTVDMTPYQKLLYGVENGLVSKVDLENVLLGMDVLEIVDLFGIV